MYSVFVLYGRDDACYYHRALAPVRNCFSEVSARGVRLDIQRVLPPKPKDCDSYDAYVFHGLDLAHNLGHMGRWLRAGKKVVWAVDDDYFSIPEHNPVRIDPSLRGQLEFVRGAASEIWCSTRPLADTFAEQAAERGVPVRVLPNLLEFQAYATPQRTAHWHRAKPLRVLWAGSATHREDLKPMAEGFRRLMGRLHEDYRGQVRLTMFGMPPEGALFRDHLFLDAEYAEPVPFPQYFDALKKHLGHVAVCPLADDTFNLSKSPLKVAEMAATRHAVVASPVGPYRDFPGVLYAADEREWCGQLERLVEDPAARAAAAQESYDHVYANLNWAKPECRLPWVEAFAGLAD